VRHGIGSPGFRGSNMELPALPPMESARAGLEPVAAAKSLAGGFGRGSRPDSGASEICSRRPPAIRWVLEPLLDRSGPRQVRLCRRLFRCRCRSHYVINGRGRAVRRRARMVAARLGCRLGGEIGAGRDRCTRLVRKLRDNVRRPASPSSSSAGRSGRWRRRRDPVKPMIPSATGAAVASATADGRDAARHEQISDARYPVVILDRTPARDLAAATGRAGRADFHRGRAGSSIFDPRKPGDPNAVAHRWALARAAVFGAP